ncbi:MAG: hypothetical protein ACYCW6_26665 [Candidatus Xenobia bacterium]
MNALLWRYDRRQPSWNRTLARAAVALAAGVIARGEWHGLVSDPGPMVLGLWIWTSLLLVLGASMLHSWQRVVRERDRGTLELLSCTRGGARGLLHSELLIEQRWLASQLWLLVLWGAWAAGDAFSTTFFRICCLTTFPVVAVIGSLAGIRIALTGRAASTLAACVLAPLSIAVLPLAMFAVQDLPAFEIWSWLMALKAHMITVFTQATVAVALYQACEQALRDGAVLPGTVALRLPTMQWLHARIARLDPFVQRERWRLWQRPVRLWTVMAVGILALGTPWVLSSLWGCPLWLSVMVCGALVMGAAWIAAWAAGAEVVQAEVDARTIDGLLTLPMTRVQALEGLTLAGLTPLALGTLITLPVWGTIYVTQVGPVVGLLFLFLTVSGAILAARLAVTRGWRRLEG